MHGHFKTGEWLSHGGKGGSEGGNKVGDGRVVPGTSTVTGFCERSEASTAKRSDLAKLVGGVHYVNVIYFYVYLKYLLKSNTV